MKGKLILVLLAVFLIAASVSIVVADDDSEKLSLIDEDKLSESLDNLTVNVVWDDDNNADGKRPSSIHAGFEGYGDDLGSFSVSADDNWSRFWENLGAYQITDQVSLVADDVSGYNVAVSGSLQSREYTITYTLIKETPKENSTASNDTDKVPQTGTDSTNEKSPEKTTTTTVKKTTTTTTTTKEVPKKNDTPKKAKKFKDKHNSGNPILLGVLAFAVAGLAYNFTRKD